MKIKEMIAALRKFDPDMPVINMVGDCNEVYEADGPIEIWIDNAEEPMSVSTKKTAHHRVKAVRL